MVGLDEVPEPAVLAKVSEPIRRVLVKEVYKLILGHTFFLGQINRATFGDLDEFKLSGGKLITYVGTDDQLIMPRGVMHYYRQMASHYGDGNPDFEELHSFYRLFRAPGVGHCGGGAGPQPQNAFEELVD